MQYKLCVNIANGEKLPKNPNFEPDIFRFRGKVYPLFDLWGLATTYLLNNVTYKNKCLEHGMLTNSGTFFKTSAESSYRYLQNKYDFDEAHTALDDAIIESYILHKIAQRHAITIGIKYFPFRDLGYTYDHVMRRKVPNLNECEKVVSAINAYIETKDEETAYVKGLLKKVDMLLEYMGAN
jgi:pyrroloquinoline quinone (PQQ) biosynthesis protein C